MGVTRIDELVLAVEQINARHTTWLRLFQSALMTMVLAGAAVMVVLLYVWIIRPLDDLQTGVAAIRDGRLGVQVPVDKLSEFAQLDNGFNQMSRRLHEFYSHLEQEVAEKTRDLAEKNFTLTTLYSFSRLLNQTQTEAGASTLFLDKIMRLLPANASSIRLLDFRRDSMDLIAQKGLPENLQNAEACQHLEECFCGNAVLESDWKPIRFMDPHTRPEPDPTYRWRTVDIVAQGIRFGFHKRNIGLDVQYRCAVQQIGTAQMQTHTFVGINTFQFQQRQTQMIGSVRATGGKHSHFAFAAQTRRPHQGRPSFIPNPVKHKLQPHMAETVQTAHAIGRILRQQRQTDVGGGYQARLAGDTEFLFVRRDHKTDGLYTVGKYIHIKPVSVKPYFCITRRARNEANSFFTLKIRYIVGLSYRTIRLISILIY